MDSKELKGAVSLANCARKIPGPFIVAAMPSPSRSNTCESGRIKVSKGGGPLDTRRDLDLPALLACAQNGVHCIEYMACERTRRSVRRTAAYHAGEFGYAEAAIVCAIRHGGRPGWRAPIRRAEWSAA